MPTNFVCGFKKKFGGVVMPKYFIDLKKCWGGGVCGRMPKHFRDLEKMLVRGGGVMPKYFTDLKNVGGGYANKFMDLKNVGGLC